MARRRRNRRVRALHPDYCIQAVQAAGVLKCVGLFGFLAVSSKSALSSPFSTSSLFRVFCLIPLLFFLRSTQYSPFALVGYVQLFPLLLRIRIVAACFPPPESEVRKKTLDILAAATYRTGVAPGSRLAWQGKRARTLARLDVAGGMSAWVRHSCRSPQC